MSTPPQITLTFHAQGQFPEVTLSRRTWDRGRWHYRMLRTWNLKLASRADGLARVADILEQIQGELLDEHYGRAVPQAPPEPRTGRWGADEVLPIFRPHVVPDRLAAGLDDLDDLL